MPIGQLTFPCDPVGNVKEEGCLGVSGVYRIENKQEY